jgi:WWE domain
VQKKRPFKFYWHDVSIMEVATQTINVSEDKNIEICKRCRCCSLVYDINYIHCCQCKSAWECGKEVHCHRCCVICDVDNKHCCKCKSAWDFRTQYHCKICCVTFDDINKHCCVCKNTWNIKEEKHCSTCHCTGKLNTNHCCKCKVVYDPIVYIHCNTCCELFNRTDLDEYKNHACKCDHNNDVFNEVIMVFRRFLTNMNLKYTFIESKCLGRCESSKKFACGIESIGFNTFETFLSNSANYRFVFHGTPNITNAKNICCESWNVKLRSKQVHGSGEYFSTNIKTAEDYADSYGAIVASIIVASKIDNIKQVSKGYDETWYVIDNNCYKTFCLPIGIIKHCAKIDSYRICNKKEHNLLSKRVQNIKNVYFSEEDGWMVYNDYTTKMIQKKCKNNEFCFEIIIDNGRKIKIDFLNMIQTDLETGKIMNVAINTIG